MLKRTAQIFVGLVLVGGIIWWSMGPDWRRLLSDMPADKDLLFWRDNQRTAAFRMMDQIPFLIKSRPIKAGQTPRTLPAGPALPDSVDIETFMQENKVAGLVILHKGRVRYAGYGLEFGAEGRWTSFSVAKSLTSTLVGAAIKDGFITSLDANVADTITGLKGSAYDGVTIEQLLTMSSGVAWNEDYSDPNSDVALFNQHKPAGDINPIVDYMRRLKRAHTPGTVWNYSTGETNMIGLLVREATGKTLADYAAEKIWQPYGMAADASWLLDDAGAEISGCCIQASTMDFARIGQFMLDGAKVNGVSIVPDDWIKRATKRYFDVPGRDYGYGFQWWTYQAGAYGARGIFGQSIYIDPARQLVIAINGSWADAIGLKEGQNARRSAFEQAVVTAIDTEAASANDTEAAAGAEK